MNKGLNYTNRYVYPQTKGKYPITTTVEQERFGATAEIEKILKSFDNPNTSVLSFTSSFGQMSVKKDVLAQDIYKDYPPEAILDFFSALSVINHVLIFTNVLPVFLRLKLGDRRTRYDLPLDLFWECINDSMKCKCGYDPKDKINSVQKLLRYYRKTYSRLNLPDAGKLALR